MGTGGEGMEVHIQEAMRYLGAGRGDEALARQVAESAREIAETPRHIYRVFTLEGTSLPQLGLDLPGKTAETMLKSCEKVVLLACTLGQQFDALLRAAQARDMAKAVILDGCGSALVEQGCDAAEREIAGRFPSWYLTDRFSPGYGDLPLDGQRALFAVLDCHKEIGLYLNESLLMSPTKSVTAIVGLSREDHCGETGCKGCEKKDCSFRKG